MIITFIGYNQTYVLDAIKKVMINAKGNNVMIENPKRQLKIPKNHPELHGAKQEDLFIYIATAFGTLRNIKKTINIKTPKGVMIELLPELKS